MVVFILAAAAAFLFCVPLAPKQSTKWLKEKEWLNEKARALLLTLFLFLFAAVLFVLVAAAASPGEVGALLLSLPILILIFAMGNLMYRQPAPGATQPAAVEWLDKYGLSPDPESRKHLAAFVGDKAHLVVLGLVVVAFLVPVALLAIPFSSFWFRPVAAVLAIYTWLIVAGLHASLTRSTDAAFNWLGGQKRQAGLILGSLLFTALLSTLIAWNGDAWAYAILLTIRRIASMPETIHALLGVVAGLMCGNFSRWMSYAHSLGVEKGEPSSKSQPDHGATSEARQTNKTKNASANSAPGSTRRGRGSPPPRNEQTSKHADDSTGKATSETWPMIIFAGALASVVIAALLAPFAPATLSRVTGLETPYLKVQFAISPAEKQQVLNVERDVNNFDTLEGFPRTLRFIQYDCAQAAFDANVTMEEFKHDRKYRVFIAGLAFRWSVMPYVNRILNAKRKNYVNAQRENYNSVVLKGRARQVAEKFALLATTREFEKSYREAMSEIDRQKPLFDDEDVKDSAPLEEINRQNVDRDPPYCRPSDAEIKLASERFDMDNINNVRTVVRENPRLVLGFAAALFFFAGDADAANAMMTTIFLDMNTYDTNTIGGYANALYVGGNDPREAIQMQQTDLQGIELRFGQVERAKVWSDEEIKINPNLEMDRKMRADLARRYDRARFQVRLLLAYIMAQHGLGSDDDLLPQRDLHWSSAQKYVDDAYASLLDKNNSPPRFVCTDHDLDLAIKDTYAFVKLAYEAYNLKTQRKLPDEFQVRQARDILEGVLAEARGEHRRVMEAMARGEAARSCFTEVETKAWVKRISSHLKLADALRP